MKRGVIIPAVLLLGALWGAVLANPAESIAPPKSEWEVSEKGSISGTLTFSRRRPNQPIVIYLERAVIPKYDPPTDSLVIGQKGGKFEPDFSAVVRGTQVVFDNDEEKDIDHNVYTLGCHSRDFGVFGKGKQVDHRFQEIGELRLHCSIHKFMDGKIFIAPTPAFTIVPGKTNTFHIENVPVGNWTLKTYQRAKRFYDAQIEIEIRKGETTKVTVEMKR